MISIARVSCTISPSSLTQEKSKYSTRSSPSCRIASNLPFPSRFRRSMQNIGGALGFSTVTCVRCTLARSAAQENSTFAPPVRPRKATSSSSRVGWWIFSIRESSNGSSSCRTTCKYAPSNAMFDSSFLTAGGESPLTLRPNFKYETGSVTAGGESPLTLRPDFKCKTGSVTAGGESPLTLRPNFKCERGSVTAGGESPLTLRPNFKCETGSVTAAAAACSPRRGSFVGENL